MQGFSLNSISLSALKNITNSQNKKLEKAGLHTVQDLLLHFPLRYEKRTNFYQIKDLIPGLQATTKGKVLNCKISSGSKKMMICQISDGSGILTIRFFNFNLAMKRNLSVGQYIFIYGETKYGNCGIEMIHPECYSKDEFTILASKNALTPIYPIIEGLSQVTLRKLTDCALNLLDSCTLVELLPLELANNMPSLSEALHMLHRPPISIQIGDLNRRLFPAQRRLIFEELIAHNLCMLSLRANMQRFRAKPLIIHNKLKKKFLSLLPFKLTNEQTRAILEIERDMASDKPMMRLVQGDVGSGKTLVAALAALCAILNDKQVALMAPTELLAEQHVNNFRNWFSPLGIRVGWLSGKQKKKARLKQQKDIANGKIRMIVGTHAIFQENVQFHNLSLIIIDEQHRFGVHQRLSLWKKGFQKGSYPHQLIMTATPIPRTLAMTTYANLDTSVIKELPKGRIPVVTVAIPDVRRDAIINRVRHFCINEGQAYWICTLIDHSNLLEAQAAKTTWEGLKIALPELNVGLLHGRMKLFEKQEVMRRFEKGDLHLLVATTVIEVGMNVPYANLIIIENSERLGLAQLHQLRGRVGRSTAVSYCVLLYRSPLSQIAYKRLQILRENNDGFVIAQKDLEIRGPGELLGTRQTGNAEFKIANLLRDQEIIPEVQRVARYIHQYYPKKAEILINRWISKIECYSSI